MALIGNRSVLLKSPGRFLSGTVASIERSNFSRPGQMANRFQAMSRVAGGLPSGHLAPSSWSLPRTAGALAARNTIIGTGAAGATAQSGQNLDATLTGAGGITSGVLGLIVSIAASIAGSGGVSSATTQALATITATLAGTGSVSATAAGLASLQASLTGAGSVTANNTALMQIAASIRGYGDLTPEGIRDTVWTALLAQYQDDGTAGKALATASSGGVDLNALAAAVWAYASRTLTGAATALTPEQATQLQELHRIHGLESGIPLSVTPTQRTAGAITQNVSEAGDTVTVERA